MPISFLVPQIPAAMGSFAVGEAKRWFSPLDVLLLFRVGAQAPANMASDSAGTASMESVWRVFSKTHSYCKKNKITFFLLTTSGCGCGCGCGQPQVLSQCCRSKTLCPMKPHLNSLYRKYDSKHFETRLFSFLWHALGLCWINCWQSQGPGTSLEEGFLAFFFFFSLFTILVTY